MEGTKNKIKTLTRQAYGYRDQEFFKLRMPGIHEAKYRQGQGMPNHLFRIEAHKGRPENIVEVVCDMSTCFP